MPGVGKLLKQAQKMQRQMEALQEELAKKELEISSGGGAVKIVITAQGDFKKLSIDPEFLKEDAALVEETLLAAVQEAASTAKTANDEAMQELTGGAAGGLGGLF